MCVVAGGKRGAGARYSLDCGASAEVVVGWVTAAPPVLLLFLVATPAVVPQPIAMHQARVAISLRAKISCLRCVCQGDRDELYTHTASVRTCDGDKQLTSSRASSCKTGLVRCWSHPGTAAGRIQDRRRLTCKFKRDDIEPAGSAQRSGSWWPSHSSQFHDRFCNNGDVQSAFDSHKACASTAVHGSSPPHRSL